MFDALFVVANVRLPSNIVALLLLAILGRLIGG